MTLNGLQEFPRASPSETPSGKGLYLIVYSSSRPNTNTILFSQNLLPGDSFIVSKKTNDRQTATCSDISCLAVLLRVLKVEKELVRNFLAQKQRVFAKIKLMGELEI